MVGGSPFGAHVDFVAGQETFFYLKGPHSADTLVELASSSQPTVLGYPGSSYTYRVTRQSLCDGTTLKLWINDELVAVYDGYYYGSLAGGSYPWVSFFFFLLTDITSAEAFWVDLYKYQWGEPEDMSTG